jgi:putative flavoprotein involved in K+ transport
VIWCTGYARNYSWINLLGFPGDNYPAHSKGVALGEPGLYFVGLPYQTSRGIITGWRDWGRCPLYRRAHRRAPSSTLSGKHGLPPGMTGHALRGGPLGT